MRAFGVLVLVGGVAATPTVTFPTGTPSFTSSLSLPSMTATGTKTDSLSFTLQTQTSSMSLPTVTGTWSETETATESSSLTHTQTVESTATGTLSLTLPTYSDSNTMTVPSATVSATLPSDTDTMTLPTKTESSTETLPSATKTGTATLPTATKTKTTDMVDSYSSCAVDGHFRRVESNGQEAKGSKVQRFYLPGENPGRLAEVTCVTARIRDSWGQCPYTPTIQVRLVYGLPGAEKADFCAGDDCEETPPTHKGACLRARKGSEDEDENKNKDICVQIGDKAQAFSPDRNVSIATSWFKVDPKVDSTPVFTGAMGMGDLIASYDFLLMNDRRDGHPFFFKSHGCGLAHFFFETRVNASAECRYRTDVSFTAKASRPESGYCFKPEDTVQEFKGGENEGAREAGRWLNRENLTSKDYNFDLPAALQPNLPRSANLKYEIDNVLVSSGKSYAWVVGDGPTVDIDCLHLHSTAVMFDQVAHSKTYDHNGYVNYRCYDSLFGANGVANTNPDTHPNSNGWKYEFDEHHAVTTRQETYGLHLIETVQCSAATDPTITGDISNYLKISRFSDAGYDAALWTTCCQQTTQDACGDIESGDVKQCIWVNKNYLDTTGQCLPAVSSTAVDLKRQVGVNKPFSYLSSIAAQPLSAYILQRELNDAGLFGLNRQWVLQYANNYGTKAQPCTQCVTIGFKSNTHGGVCEPAGKQFCEAQMDKCVVTPRDQWPGFWALKNGQTDLTTLSSEDDGRYRICNCLKQKENCYRNVGCTSTKRYQLILQNCYEVGCGNTCIRGY
eukprot:Hpha_TRINITY_DN15409_c0_g6::TRINITY_DN15409_c0_g6_i1::g.176007::m.176007